MNKVLKKWNYEKQEYEPYEVPYDWNVATFETDMEKIINCAGCGRKIMYGDCYTSRTIHTNMGMGYSVCGECYTRDFVREKIVGKY